MDGVATAAAGPLAACDTVRAPTHRFRISITGALPLVGADQTSSYLIVGSGPDGDFATGGCASGEAGDDVPIEIASLSLVGVDTDNVATDLRVNALGRVASVLVVYAFSSPS